MAAEGDLVIGSRWDATFGFSAEGSDVGSSDRAASLELVAGVAPDPLQFQHFEWNVSLVGGIDDRLFGGSEVAARIGSFQPDRIAKTVEFTLQPAIGIRFDADDVGYVAGVPVVMTVPLGGEPSPSRELSLSAAFERQSFRGSTENAWSLEGVYKHGSLLVGVVGTTPDTFDSAAVGVFLGFSYERAAGSRGRIVR